MEAVRALRSCLTETSVKSSKNCIYLASLTFWSVASRLFNGPGKLCLLFLNVVNCLTKRLDSDYSNGCLSETNLWKKFHFGNPEIDVSFLFLVWMNVHVQHMFWKGTCAFISSKRRSEYHGNVIRMDGRVCAFSSGRSRSFSETPTFFKLL